LFWNSGEAATTTTGSNMFLFWQPHHIPFYG